MKCALSILLAFAVAASAACLPVTGDRILARDLAAAEPQFSVLPGSLQLAFTPAPGMSRNFTAAELQRLARANGITLTSPVDVCFEMQLHKPTEAEFIESMRRSITSSAKLNIVEMWQSPIPSGRIEFPLSGLTPPTAGGSSVRLWRGFVQYTETRRLAIWARVAVLEEPPVARRGDTVLVEVRSGFAVLRFEAIAQNTLRNGDIADLRNPSTGKVFHARIDGSKAILTVGKGPAL